MEIFEKKTGVKVEFEKKSFEQIRQNAAQILNSDEAPDVMEYNKGNATAGLLASQGLLRDPDAPAPVHEFRATGDPESFAVLARRFLGPEVTHVTRSGLGTDSPLGGSTH